MTKNTASNVATSFKATNTIGTEAPVTASPTVTESTTLVAVPISLKIGAVQGEVQSSDIVRPSLNIVQAVGPLSEDFVPGQIVVNRELVIAEPEKPITLMVLALNRFYVENVPYDGDVQARSFQTMEQVKAAGLHTEWINDQKPPCSPAARALVAIQREDEHGLYPFSFDGKHYMLAEWMIRGVAFTRAGKLIITASQWNLREGLHNGSWSLSTRREKLGSNYIWIPVLKAGPRNSPELASFFTSLG